MDAQVETVLVKNITAKTALDKVLKRKEEGVIAWDKLSLSRKGLLEVTGMLAARIRVLMAS